MSTAELKINLINQITLISDKVKLKELKQLISFLSDESIHKISSEDKEAILEAKEQVLKGEVIPNEELQTEVKKWLEN